MSSLEIIYGRNAVAEALKSRQTGPHIARLLIAEGVEDKHGPVAELLKTANSRKPLLIVKRISRQEMDRLTHQANHQGVAAEVPPYPYTDFDELLGECQINPAALVLVLDAVQDTQNLGTLLRSAEVAGVTGVVLPERRAAGVTPAVRNSSSGAVEHLRICQVVNLSRALEELKKLGVWVAGLEDEPEAEPYDKANLTGRLALVVGNEGAGLSRLVRDKCDFFVALPMLGQIASLNAAVAGSIALYEALRQRQPNKPDYV